MTKLNAALGLAAAGFHVFPCVPNGKKPLIKDWQKHAARDHATLHTWFRDDTANIGIFTGKFRDDEALLVVDVDTKAGKDGNAALLAFELAGLDLPDTRESSTPSGGRHLFFRVQSAVRQSAGRLGAGVDVRSRGGYVLGPGSTIDGREYRTSVDREPAPAPQWLVDRCGASPADRPQRDAVPAIRVDQSRAHARALAYLRTDAPLAVEGQGGDETTYRVACRLKDFGLGWEDAWELMAGEWNGRCSPPWDQDSLATKVSNAYAYGENPLGVADPAADFEPVAEIPTADGSYLDQVNADHALVFEEGGHTILHETQAEDGTPRRRYLPEASFKRKFSAKKIADGKRTITWAESWLDWSGRREYQGVCFSPGREPRNGYYNLWRGFAVEPVAFADASDDAREGFQLWMEHVRANACRGDVELTHWLLGYFAHMVQRPWERPLTTLVFRGGKGVGKNALVDRVGRLLRPGHYLVAHHQRFLTSNFNGHLESCLCMVLDEAFWSGNKDADSQLKGITTSPKIMIERKGKEPTWLDNFVRLIVLGNDNWLVPASPDERRYAVFDVGKGRQKDLAFFARMCECMDLKGGAAVLLDHLQRFDLATVEVNAAPDTKALLDQKEASLDPLAEWWLSCLRNGRIIASDFEGWPREVEKERLRQAIRRYHDERRISVRVPGENSIGRSLAKWGVRAGRLAVGQTYKLPGLEDGRVAWDKWIGQPMEWA